jgi:hypothetical protein
MKTMKIVCCMSLALAGNAWAQGSVGAQGSASTQSSTSVSADRSGANAVHSGNSAAAVNSGYSSARLVEGTEMNATLTKPIDTRRAKPGDEVTATLAQEVTMASGATLPRRTTLVGRVTESEARTRRSASAEGAAASRLGFVFYKAVREDGTEVPMNATIHAVASAAGAASARDFEGDVAAASGVGASGRAAGGNVLGGIAGSAGGAIGAVGSVSGSAVGRAGSTLGGGVATASAGATGGLSAAGRLTAGSRGVFGLRGVGIVPAASGQAAVLTSSTGNIGLGRGTQMLLVASGNAAASAN